MRHEGLRSMLNAIDRFDDLDLDTKQSEQSRMSKATSRRNMVTMPACVGSVGNAGSRGIAVFPMTRHRGAGPDDIGRFNPADKNSLRFRM